MRGRWRYQLTGDPNADILLGVTGTQEVGQTLTAVPAPNWTVTGYQWYRNPGSGPVAISGATLSTYTLVNSDAGSTISCRAVGYYEVVVGSLPGLPQSENLRIALVGDSHKAYGDYWITLNAVTLTRDAAGVVTVPKSNHGIYGSQPVSVVNCADTSFEVYNVNTTYIDTNTFSYPTNVLGSPASTTGSGQTTLIQWNRHQAYGSWMWLQSMAGGSLLYRGNFGQGGDRVDQMGAAVAAACATDADIIIICGGTNDINTFAATGQQVIDRMQVHVSTIRAAGKKCLIDSIPPLGVSLATSTKKAAIEAANAGFAAMAAADPTGVFYANAYTDEVDSASAAGAAQTWVTYDNIHRGSRAARLMAAKEWQAIQNVVQETSILPTSAVHTPTYDGYTAIKQYGAWDTASGGAAGTGASGSITPRLAVVCTSGTTAVASLVDRGAGLGYWQRLVITPGGVNHNVTISLQSTNGETLASLGLVTGDEVYLAAELAVSGGAAGNFVGINMLMRSQSSGTFGTAECGNYDANVLRSLDSFSDIFITGKFKINSSITTLVQSIGLRASAASASPITLDVGRVVLYKKTS